MLTKFQKTKLEKLFSFWDLNNNGYLEKSDYEYIARRIAEERGWESGSTQYATIHNAVMADWAQARQFADKDNNHRITISEWFAFMENTLADETAYRMSIMDMMSAILTAIDTDNDGYVTPENYRTWFRIFNVSEAEADAAFSRMDLNGDGRLSVDELLDALNNFFHSETPDSPGNAMFGVLPD